MARKTLRKSLSNKRSLRNKRSKTRKTRKTRSLRKTRKQRGGRDFQIATREMLERIPITDKVTVATEDGWVGSAKDYKAHEEYLSSQLRVTGSG